MLIRVWELGVGHVCMLGGSGRGSCCCPPSCTQCAQQVRAGDRCCMGNRGLEQIAPNGHVLLERTVLGKRFLVRPEFIIAPRVLPTAP